MSAASTSPISATSSATQPDPTQYIEVMEKICNDLDVENKQLRQETQALREKLNATREANVQLVNMINAKHQELADASSSINSLQSEVERQAGDGRVLQRGAFAMSNEILNLRDSLARATAQMQYQTQKLSERNEELLEATSLASENAEAFESSKEQIRVLLSALESAKADNLRLEQESESASWMVKSLQDQLAFVTEEKAAMMMRSAAQEASQETEATREAREAANREEREIIEGDAIGLLQSDCQDLSNEGQPIYSGGRETMNLYDEADKDHQDNTFQQDIASACRPGRPVVQYAVGAVVVCCMLVAYNKGILCHLARWGRKCWGNQR